MINDAIVSPSIPQEQDEIWMDIPPYAGIYQASNLGRIRGLLAKKGRAAGRILTGYKSRAGYHAVRLYWQGTKEAHPVHRLVLMAFHYRPDYKSYEVRHKNGKLGDNRVENLEWVTHKEAVAHSKRHVNPRPRVSRRAVYPYMTPDELFETQDLTGEEWRILPIYNNAYEVSSAGRVRAMYQHKKVKVGQILRGYVSNRYHYVRLGKGGNRKPFGVHRLVMMAFDPIEGYEKLDVNHIDGNPNNNRLENLEWATRSQNILHAVHVTKTKIPLRGEEVGGTCLCDDDVREIRRLYFGGITQTDLAARYGVSQVAISMLVRGLTWKHVD